VLGNSATFPAGGWLGSAKAGIPTEAAAKSQGRQLRQDISPAAVPIVSFGLRPALASQKTGSRVEPNGDRHPVRCEFYVLRVYEEEMDGFHRTRLYCPFLG